MNQIYSWNLLKAFYQSFSQYQKIEANFRKILKKYSHWEDGKKPIEEVLQIFDTSELNILRDGQLRALRHLAHSQYRNRKITERFDIYISEIFHEVSILKEQKFILDHYFQRKEQMYPEMTRQLVLQTLQLFETKMDHVKVLFNNAKARLEEILPNYRFDDFLLRSLYLEGEEIFKAFYRKPVRELLDLLFTAGGVPMGYLAICCSFSVGGFYENAYDALKQIKKKEILALNDELKNLYEKLKQFLVEHELAKDKAATYQDFLEDVKPHLIVLKNH